MTLVVSVITWNKKDSSKQVVSMINKLGKEFFSAATSKGSLDVYFETVKKLVVYFGLYESSLHFSRRDDQKNTAYWK